MEKNSITPLVISKPSLDTFISEAEEYGPKCWLGTFWKKKYNAQMAEFVTFIQVSGYTVAGPGHTLPIIYREQVDEGVAGLTHDIKEFPARLEKKKQEWKEILEGAGLVVYDGILESMIL